MIEIVGSTNRGMYKFIADSASDMANLPTTSSAGKSNLINVKSCVIGSQCFVMATSKTYALTSNDTWIEITVIGGGGVSDIIEATQAQIDSIWS